MIWALGRRKERGQTCVQTCRAPWLAPVREPITLRVSGRAAELRSQGGAEGVWLCLEGALRKGCTMTCGSLSALMEMEEAGLWVEWATAGVGGS